MGLSFRTSRRTAMLQVAKSAIATTAAWVVTSLVIPTHLPIFAAIAALLVVQPSVNQSLAKGIERSVGVIAGVVVASGISLLFNGWSTWLALIAVLVSLIIAWMLKMTPGTANQVAISAMLVLALGSNSPEYAFDRVLETLIGAFIGILVNVTVVPPVHIEKARKDVALLAAEVAASLGRLADALSSPQSAMQMNELMLHVRLLRPMNNAANASVEAAEESLTLNPRRSAHRGDLAEIKNLLDQRLTPMVTQVIGMTRASFDHYDPTLSEEPTIHAIAEQLWRAAHDVKLQAHLAEVSDNPITSNIPALTAPLVIAPPQSSHWILIGSLMEDLRRVHEELLHPNPGNDQ